MPLPFLTADRDLDNPESGAADPVVPLSHADPDRWRRPYRPGPWRVAGAALLLLLASFVLFSLVAVALTGGLSAAAGCAAVALVVLVLALRLLRVGVWVSARGLRHVALLRTRTLPWGQVGAVRTVQQPVRWLSLPRTVQGQALQVVTGSGEPLPTLLTDHNADFAARPEGFARASDVLEAWAEEYGAGRRG